MKFSWPQARGRAFNASGELLHPVERDTLIPDTTPVVAEPAGDWQIPPVVPAVFLGDLARADVAYLLEALARQPESNQRDQLVHWLTLRCALTDRADA